MVIDMKGETRETTMVADLGYYTGKNLMVEVARTWGMEYETFMLCVSGTERVVDPDLTLVENGICEETVLQMVRISDRGDDEPSERPRTLGSFLFEGILE